MDQILQSKDRVAEWIKKQDPAICCPNLVRKITVWADYTEGNKQLRLL